MIDRKKFFDGVRSRPFKSLSASQVSGTEAILKAWEDLGTSDIRQLSYVLATAYHESDATMQPIREYGHGAGHAYGTTDLTGKAPYGRGLVQLTWAYNYAKADTALGLDGALVKNYDLALDPVIASEILIRGMIEGWFTGKKLSDYIGAGKDYTGARRIVNGTDKAALIAGYAVEFEAALKPATVAQPSPVAPVSAPPVVEAPKPAAPAPVAPLPGTVTAPKAAVVGGIVGVLILAGAGLSAFGDHIHAFFNHLFFGG